MERATQTLHRLTSYAPGRDWTEPLDDPRLRQDLQVNDRALFPWFYKRYADPPVGITLPRSLPRTTAPAVAVLAGTADVVPAAIDLSQLSRLLHLSAGVVRTASSSFGPFLFRAAGSAGGRFPLEVYVAIPDGMALPGGVHWYHPQDHVLVPIGPPPRGAALAIVITGIPWRTGWRYRERGYRHVYWDAGTMLSQLLAAARSAGLTAHLYTRFPDQRVAALVGADGVHEWPVAVVALADAPPALDATGAATTGAVAAAPREFPLVTTAQRAGQAENLGSPWDEGSPVDAPVPGRASIDDAVLARGSQRRMDPRQGLEGSLLATSMLVAQRGVAGPHHVVAHQVSGVEPGVYRWPDLARPIRAGDYRDELYRVCLDQGLARDGAFVVITSTRVADLDDRQYRDAHLGAGLLEGRLHLLAYALGASASGMTFLDSEVPALLSAPVDPLLFTCVGAPEYRSAPGGMPGTPTSVRMVTPRLGAP